MARFKIGKHTETLHTSALVATISLALALTLTACDSGATPTVATAQSPAMATAGLSSTSTAAPGTGTTGTTVTSGTQGTTPGSSGSQVINVVAAENFWGDIVKQIGGSHVLVTSILSDPNVDPHEYESNVQNGVAVTKAQMVIENGGGYDDWIDKLISASPNSNRLVLSAFDISPNKLPDNEHVFYGIDNAKAVAQSIADSLKKLDNVDSSTFDANLQMFDMALAQISQKMDEIKAIYSGKNVGLTETIFLYQTGPLGLNVLTPLEFEKAIAEGNDPPADTVIAANDQINNKQIKVLIYNSQTVTPITDNLKSAAQAHGIPIVAVTETMPPDKNYQTWMLDQLTALEQALGSAK